MNSDSDMKEVLLIEKNKRDQENLEHEYELKEIKVDQVCNESSEFKSLDIIHNNSTNMIASFFIIDSRSKNVFWHVVGFVGVGLCGAAFGAGLYCYCDNGKDLIPLNVFGSLMMTASGITRLFNVIDGINLAAISTFFNNRFFNPLRRLAASATNYGSLLEDEKNVILNEIKTIDIHITDQTSLWKIEKITKEEKIHRAPEMQNALGNMLSSTLNKIGIFTKNPCHKLILEYALTDDSVIKRKIK